MRAQKVSVTVPEDHRLEVSLPVEQRPMTEVIEELRSIQPTDDEERILEGFETFRQDHPFRMSSLPEP